MSDSTALSAQTTEPAGSRGRSRSAERKSPNYKLRISYPEKLFFQIKAKKDIPR